MNGDHIDDLLLEAAPPYRLQAASVTKYRSCVVDPRPGRAVHCPDLNACLVNEGRRVPVDCQAVHFGYAIPVSVVPLHDSPDLAELVFEPSSDIAPEAIAYLLQHHPQYKMATAKHEPHVQKFAGEEDIAAIAKQISDHAEAIYQTWKSRGLAPAEILTCHGDAGAADKFGTALTPDKTREGGVRSPSPHLVSQRSSEQIASPRHEMNIVKQRSADSPAPSINANNLEQLVNDFVVEDKARLAAARQRALPSSIQFALQKFEKQGSGEKPVVQYATKPSPPYQQEHVKPAPPYVRPSTAPEPAPAYRAPILQETIETVYPVDLEVQRRAGRRSSEGAYTGGEAQEKKVHRRSSEVVYGNVTEVEAAQKKVVQRRVHDGLLEKKLNRRSSEPVFPIELDDVAQKKVNRRSSELVYASELVGGIEAAQKKSAGRRSSEYVDEVAREEERLINALKAGIVIAEEPPGLDVAQEKKKKNLLLKKKKKTRVDEPDMGSLSLVDYAKSRYQAAQETPLTQQRLADARRLDQQMAQDSHGQHIEAARNKFEGEGDDEAPRRQKSGKKPARPADGMPHPELTSLQRMRAAALHATAHHATSNPVRPFLTRGSVAERVMIFEKCPTTELLLLDKRRTTTPAIATWRTGNEVHSKAQNYVRDTKDSKPPNTTLQRHVKANRSAAGAAHIPRFYFPRGKPQPESLESVAQKIGAVFAQFPAQQVPRDKFSLVTKACDFPLYWKIPLFIAAGGAKLGYVEANTFLDFWKRLTSTSHDEAARFVFVLTKGARNYVLPEDLMAMVQDVVDTHPGLTFLKEAIEFHSRYVHTVIARIFYTMNRSWSGRLSLSELRRGSLLPVLRLLESEDDINQVTTFFSYEHFYVIYCKFWELDRDHDLFIDKNDLQRHNDHALSSRMIERIFSGAVTRGAQQKMSYTEFVWFLLSEEDKTHPTAVEYWFRCMDLDGDGYLSMYELEYFYEEQMQRLDAIGIETLPFQDCLCQMLDMIRPTEIDKISLSDLRRCKMSAVFFDTFFNLEKYLEHEQRDPFAAQRDPEDADTSPWDRYAADEYEALVAEEGGQDHGEDMCYEEEEEGDDIFSPNLDNIEDIDAELSIVRKKPRFKVTDFDGDEDDEGDYARDSDGSA